MAELEYLTPEQVAEKLQMNARVVRRMLAAGKLPGKRVGRIWRVSADALHGFMSEGNTATSGGTASKSVSGRKSKIAAPRRP